MTDPSKEILCYNCFQKKAAAEGPCPYCGFDLAENEAKYPVALRAGTVLNRRYVVGRVLGQGGFGITYLAWDSQLDAKVAIKEFMPGEIAARLEGTTVSVMSADRSEDFAYGAERFQEEARTLAKFIGNPNIAGVSSYFDENGTSYFVMDYIEGISFKTYIANQGGKVSAEEALDVMIPVLRALTAVHREGFIHRDVTPDNIYITKDGMVKLLDFGSARYSIGDKSKSLDVILKVGYAPKEQYIRRSRQGPYTDVYSCAACFYAAMTGFLPPEALERLEHDTLAPVSQCGIPVPEYLDKAILKGLAVQPEDRFQNAEEFLEAIENQQVVELRQPEAPGAGTAPQPSGETKSRLRPAFAAAAAAAVVVLAAGIGYLAGGTGTDSDNSSPSASAAVSALPSETPEPVPDVLIAGKSYSAALAELDLSGAGLTDQDLRALSQMTQLTTLSLANNPDITDLSALSGLTGLTSLNIMDTGVFDLSPLAGLVHLEELMIANPDVSDLSPLSSLSRLKILRLDNGSLISSQITDLSPLAGLSGLEQLYIPPMPDYTDFSCLSGLTNLRVLRMVGTRESGSNHVDSLEFLKNMKQLEVVCLVVQSGDLSSAAGLTQLRELSLHGDLTAPDTGVFRDLTQLEVLSLRSDSICSAADMEDFSGLTRLRELNLTLDGVTSLAGLEPLTQVETLELYLYGDSPSQTITDLEPLRHMAQLRRLRLYAAPSGYMSSPALQIDALADLKQLQTVDIGPSIRISRTSALPDEIDIQFSE